MYQWILRDYTLVYMIAKGLVSRSDSSPCTKYLRVLGGGDLNYKVSSIL